MYHLGLYDFGTIFICLKSDGSEIITYKGLTKFGYLKLTTVPLDRSNTYRFDIDQQVAFKIFALLFYKGKIIVTICVTQENNTQSNTKCLGQIPRVAHWSLFRQCNYSLTCL